MTRREAAIVSAYTGYMLGSFGDMQEYVEELFGRPIWTHEFTGKDFPEEIHKRSFEDFIQIKIDESTDKE